MMIIIFNVKFPFYSYVARQSNSIIFFVCNQVEAAEMAACPGPSKAHTLTTSIVVLKPLDDPNFCMGDSNSSEEVVCDLSDPDDGIASPNFTEDRHKMSTHKAFWEK